MEEEIEINEGIEEETFSEAEYNEKSRQTLESKTKIRDYNQSMISVDLNSEHKSSTADAENTSVIIDIDKAVTVTKENTAFAESFEEVKVEKTENEKHLDDIVTHSIDRQDSAVELDVIRMSIINPEPSLNIFGITRTSDVGSIIESIPSVSSVVEEEESEVDINYLIEMGLQQEREPINREYYEEEYTKLKEIKQTLRLKNSFLYKKLAEYYKKRKMLRVFDDQQVETYDNSLDKYEQKILELHDTKLKITREKEAIESELEDMITLRDDSKVELERSFSEMLDREKEISHGLIDSNTGKVIQNKVIEKLLNRQKVKSNEIAEIRLSYIKRRDKIREIEDKIKALETIGGTLHLMDFEQLRMENQIFSDKIEERDEELMRLRSRYYHAVQALAHIREKNYVIKVQSDELEDKNKLIADNVSQLREKVNKLKVERDSNRAQADKLKANSGILMYSKLIYDMEISINDINELKSELDELKSENKLTRAKLIAIRHTIEKTDQQTVKRQQIETIK